MTTTPYPPLPPEGVTLSDLMGRLKKIESYLDAGDLAAMRELKAQLLSHYVDKPGSLVEMVRALVAPISGPCSHKLNIDPANLGGFEGVSFERKAETWTTYEDGGRVPDEFRATVRLRGVRRAAVAGGDKAETFGFTPPAAPAEVKPATFVDRMPKFGPPALRRRVAKPATFVDSFKGLPVVDVSALVREGLRQPVVVKQLSGEPLRYATDGSAGLDLPFAEKAVSLGAWGEALFPTGVKLEIPPGYEGQIRPRSSCPRGVEVVLGTIDSDYRGEIKVKVRMQRDAILDYSKPIAQLVIAPVARAEIVQVDSLSETARGEGGFGSTDSEAKAVLKVHTVEEVEAKVREAVRDEAQKAGARVEGCEVKVITREREKTPSELQAAADEAALIRQGEAAEVAAKAINERIKALKVGDEWTDADALKVGEEAMQAAGYGDLLCYFAETSAGRRLKVRDAFEELTPVIGEG